MKAQHIQNRRGDSSSAVVAIVAVVVIILLVGIFAFGWFRGGSDGGSNDINVTVPNPTDGGGGDAQ